VLQYVISWLLSTILSTMKIIAYVFTDRGSLVQITLKITTLVF